MSYVLTGASGFGMDVPFTDTKKNKGTANVQPTAGTCASAKGTQQMLSDLGYNPGGVDGVFGKNTYAAMASFASDHSIAYSISSPAPSAALCAAMMAAWQAKQAGIDPLLAAAMQAGGQAVPSANLSVPDTTGAAATAATALPSSAVAPSPTVAPSSSTGIQAQIDKAKAFWTGADSKKKAMIVGGAAAGLALIFLLVSSQKKAPAPASSSAPKTMTPNRRRRAKKSCFTRNGSCARKYIASEKAILRAMDAAGHEAADALEDAKGLPTKKRAQVVRAVKAQLRKKISVLEKMAGGYNNNPSCSPLKKRVHTCHCSPPANPKRRGAKKRSDYAFPECFMYPVKFTDKRGKLKEVVSRRHVAAALRYFGKYKSHYPTATRKRIAKRISRAAKALGVTQRKAR